MADMGLVIKIPEHAYEECKKVELTEALEGVPFHVMKAIANGKPLSTVEVIPLAEIDKLHNVVNEIGKNADNKGNLYYTVLDFVNRHGTHSTGDYFKLKQKAEDK